jgi:AraC family transcriptional regulator
MPNSPVPITMGSPRFMTRETDSFRVTEAWFPPGAILDPHTHDRPVLAMMLRGGFQTEFAAQRLECDAGYAWTEPNAEKHSNYVGRSGAHVLVIQPDPTREELVEPLGELLDGVHLLRHPALLCAAPGILAELHAPDITSPLAIEAHACSALSGAVRLRLRDRARPRLPGWLRCVQEFLHDEWRQAPTLSFVAGVAGVHPCHLAHTFREQLGESMGTYVRRLRVAWAIAELTATDLPISQIAHAAGFCDQSHFTRQCVRLTGVTPAAYRALVRRGQKAS